MPEYRPLSVGMRRMLYTASALVFGVGVPLLVLTEYTDAFFAWTVQPPLTAAFLGACYWSAAVLEFTAARESAWARARVAVPGVLLFTVLTCVPTVINFRHFNLRSPAAYAWIAVYFGVPPVLGWIWWRQARLSGDDEPRSAPMPGWMAAGYAGLGLALLACGLVLFLGLMRGGWPWDLNPPEGPYAHLARMEPYIGVWVLSLGTVASHAAIERDLARIKCVLISGVALPALTAVALARYTGTVRWGSPATWAFMACLAWLLVLSVAGIRRIRAATPRGDP